MAGWAINQETRLSYTSHVLPGSESHDEEPVVVSPRSTGSEFGSATIRDRVFSTHCAFSWRSEKVSTPAGDGRRHLVFNRFKQTALFHRRSLHDHAPHVGDRITRAWDGATFEIAAIYAQSGGILCDVVEVTAHLQS